MKKLIVASVHENAGKTSIIVGLCKVLNRKFGYLKPFGYRILYRKKRLWDYDAALMTNLFGLDESPSDMSIGFQHSKMSFMLDEVTGWPPHEAIRSLDELVEDGEAGLADERGCLLDERDVAVIAFSAGTCGRYRAYSFVHGAL
ncbi:MAG TPA: AAA family ATPase, partial [Syntrophales bacterium]|nr:AAA family ATPase [Syntrophales bacterium]